MTGLATVSDLVFAAYLLSNSDLIRDFEGAFVKNLILCMDIDLFHRILELGLFVSSSSRCWQLVGPVATALLGLLVAVDEVLRLAVRVVGALLLAAPVALDTPLEIVVLALAAHPAAVREVKVLLVA